MKLYNIKNRYYCEGKVLLNYEFPKDVTHRNTVYLKDLVLDHEDGGYAYITDSDSKFPGIIVFSLQQRRSWKITHKSMKVRKEAIKLIINGTNVDIKSPVSGISLSPASIQNRLVYYCPFSSYELFALPAKVLKSGERNIDKYVINLGRKSSQVKNPYFWIKLIFTFLTRLSKQFRTLHYIK